MGSLYTQRVTAISTSDILVHRGSIAFDQSPVVQVQTRLYREISGNWSFDTGETELTCR